MHGTPGKSFARESVRDDGGLPKGQQAEQLLQETEQLKEALERRPVIDMARGALVATFSCIDEEAWQILVRVSQHSTIKIHDVAEAAVAAAQQEPVPAHFQEQLAAAVAHWRARRAE